MTPEVSILPWTWIVRGVFDLLLYTEREMNRIIALGALAVGLAAQASAVSFRFQFETPVTASGGTSSISAPSAGSTNEIVNLPGATTTATALTYSFPTAFGTFTNGSGRVTSSVGSLAFTFMGSSSSTGMDGTLVTFSGGTGAYVGYTGTGVVSHTVNNTDPNYVDGQFFANIQPTPEPGTLAALSLAGVAFVRRRRAVR